MNLLSSLLIGTRSRSV